VNKIGFSIEKLLQLVCVQITRLFDIIFTDSGCQFYSSQVEIFRQIFRQSDSLLWNRFLTPDDPTRLKFSIEISLIEICSEGMKVKNQELRKKILDK